MEFLTKEEIEDFEKAFNMFDNDGSGTISSRELITAMQNLNLRPKEEEIQNIIKVLFYNLLGHTSLEIRFAIFGQNPARDLRVAHENLPTLHLKLKGFQIST